MLVVKSKIKEATDMNVSAATYDALSDVVMNTLKKGGERAAANGRKTIKPQDI